MKKYLSISILSIIAISIPSAVKAQNLFQSDSESGNIYEYTPGGVQSVFASGLINPQGIAFNSAGDLFVSDGAGDDIYEFTPGGVRSTFASGLNDPNGLAFNSAGDLFEVDVNSGNIYEFTPAGIRTTFASGLTDPITLAFDSAGNLFVGESRANIIEITPGGVQSTFAAGAFDNSGLAFNSAGDLFEADGPSGNINEFTPGGVQSTYASGFTGHAQGVAFDGTGNLFVTTWFDTTGGSIYKVTPAKQITQFATGLDYPEYMAFQPVPEPSVWAMLGMSGFALFGLRRRA